MNRYGDAVEAYTYKPFGETAIYSIASGVFTQETTSPLGNVFQFTSQFHDVESNLYHFRASTPNSQPRTQNPEPKPKTLNPKPRTQNPQPDTQSRIIPFIDGLGFTRE